MHWDHWCYTCRQFAAPTSTQEQHDATNSHRERLKEIAMHLSRTDSQGRQLPPWEQPEFRAAATYHDQPKRLVVIPGSLNEHRLASNLVEQGNVDRAVVMGANDYVSFEAWRVSPTTYAWRSHAMAAPAFGDIKPDTRPDVEGMPRWEWDLYGQPVRHNAPGNETNQWPLRRKTARS